MTGAETRHKMSLALPRAVIIPEAHDYTCKASWKAPDQKQLLYSL